MAQGRFSFGPFSSTKCGKIIGVRAAVPLALPLHARECRGCAQHGHASALPEGERSWVCNASFKVLDALCMSAGATHRGRTPIVSTDAVQPARRAPAMCASALDPTPAVRA